MTPINSRIYTLILVVLLGMVYSCKHEIPEPTGNTSSPPPSVPTNTNTNKMDSVCYEQVIQPILSSNCAKSGCHTEENPSAGIKLNSYNNLKQTLSGDLLIRVIQDTGVFAMPPGNDSLTQSQITLIKKWVSEGMKLGIDCAQICDTTEITFSKTVWPILQNNCIGCHQSDVPVFTNYNEVKALVSNGKLLCALMHQNGCSPMPKGFDGQGQPLKLSDCNLKKIARWVYLGAKND